MINVVMLSFWISGFMIIYTYVVYPGILYALLRKRSGNRSAVCNQQPTGEGITDVSPGDLSAAEEELPEVTILVSAYNEEVVIKERIENILELDYPEGKLEAIIVSDGSDDGTNDIVKRFEDKRIRLVSFEERAGKVNALNAVIPLSKGEMIVLSDANTSFRKDVLKRLAARFGNEETGCVCGCLNIRDDSGVGKLEGVYWRCEQFLKEVEGSRGSLLGANGGVYAIRKGLFKKIPDNTIVDDFVIPMKILESGKKVYYEPKAVAYEEAGKEIAAEFERRVRIGAGDFQALTLTWRMLNPFKGFSAVAYMSHKVIRWLVPFFAIIVYITNILLEDIPLYKALFMAQIVFYLLAISGMLLASLHSKLWLVSLPYYFVSMNLGLFCGFLKCCFGAQAVTWKKTER